MPIELGLFLLSVVFVSLVIYGYTQEQRKIRALQLSDVDNMTGHQFEHYVAKLLKNQGFQATVTVGSGDLGVDVVAHKGPIKYAVQVKRQQQNVSRRAVSDAVAGKIHYKCTNSMVVTNAFYTAGAQELARTTACRLVDRNELTQWILSFQQIEVKPIAPALKPLTSNSRSNTDMREYLDFDGEDFFLRNPGPVVYMIAHGDRAEYKIGLTKDINARVDKIGLQMPERVWVVHKIYTNDPRWLEQIWHKRFAAKRNNGEWFNLSVDDIAEFKKHKETNNPDLDCKSQLLISLEPQSSNAQVSHGNLPSEPTMVKFDRKAAIQRVSSYFDTLKNQHPDKAAKLAGPYKFQIAQMEAEIARMIANGKSESEALEKWIERACRSADAKVQ